MKKQRIIAASVLAGLILIPVLYVQANKWIYAHRVTEYLLHEKAYERAEIKSIEGKWGGALPPFYVVVEFVNEPKIVYTYFAHSDVRQVHYQLKGERIGDGVPSMALKNLDQKFN
ncbi:DUF3139 domain-containing protein [Saccharibacillus brassicae]|uniref:DUF3139 domain-containing protein n=1 Tax=Saccharibacillus brassicae TaxID=2583377 RepID=A0A4Y6V2N4_SACBS|nr:DUF3139 domain-containing protein [Saccharibacillus brassicae]QDH23088.1 DUF3139 domain-containing protein [Saccharibacillus brassicae]